MTIWTPDLTDRSGPKYRAIAEALAEGVDSGVLAKGDRLPTHRDLAWRLGVTVGTVSRAYALAQERGLIAGEVGRGTVVRGPASTPMGADLPDAPDNPPVPTYFAPPLARKAGSGVIDMGRNCPADPRTAVLLADALRIMAVPKLLNELEAYHPPNGLRSHRQAATIWLEELGLTADPNTTLITSGCQNALTVAMAGICKPGDRIVVEELTWPGAAQLAQSLGLIVETVAMDEEGVRPDSLEEICRNGAVRLLYTIPTLQNPTTVTMSEGRRKDIVEIARRHRLVLVEDGVFGFLSTDAPPPIRSLAPDITIYATSLSKAVSPSLRIGYLAVPDTLVSPLATIVKATMLMPPTLGAQLAAELVVSGAAGLAAERQRENAVDRQRLARQILGGYVGQTNPDANQIWMDLPPHWNARQFAEAAMARGVSVNPGYSFMPTPAGDGPSKMRVCLATESNRQRIEDGLHILAELLASHPPEPIAIV
jgi:DNA-binding transcriptional MocR family regulator